MPAPHRSVRAVVRFAALLRRQGLPITPAPGARTPCARSTTSTSATARRSTSGCARCSSRGPRSVPDLRPLLRVLLARRRWSPTAGQALPGPEIPRRTRPTRPVDSSGQRAARARRSTRGATTRRTTAASRSACPASPTARRWSTQDFSTFCRRSAGRGAPPHRADRQAPGAADQPAPAARAAPGPRGPAAHAAGESHAGRDHRAALPRSASGRKVRLVLLCDVSGSMDLYSRFLLQFLFALQSVFGRVETFTFSTRLTRITEYLKARSYRAGAAAARRRCATGRGAPGSASRWPSSTGSGARWSTAAPSSSCSPTAGTPATRSVLATELLRIKRRAGARDLAQPAARQPLVRAADPRHGGGAAARRPLRRRPQPRRAARPGRTRSID